MKKSREKLQSDLQMSSVRRLYSELVDIVNVVKSEGLEEGTRIK